MELLDIAVNIHKIRTEKKISLAILSDHTGVSAGFLSRIENYRTIPSLSLLSKIAEALEVSMEDLVRMNGPSLKYVHTKKGEGYRIDREFPESGIGYFALAKGLNDKSMDPFLIEIPAKCRRSAVTTDGDEFFMVIQGELHYFIGNEEIFLKTGDSLYFRGSIPHYPDNRTDSKTILLGVYSMPNE